MSPLTTTTIVLLGLFIYLVSPIVAQLPQSVCPEVFQYGEESAGRWNGVLTLRTEFPLTGLWVRIEFNTKVELVGSMFDAVITTTDNLSYLFSNPAFLLQPDNTLLIQFFVNYNELGGAPQVTRVRLNGRPLCPTPTVAPRISPCPSVMLYEEREEDSRWFGIVTVRSDVELEGLWVKVVLDTPAELVGSKFGDVKSTDNQEFVFSKRDHILKPGDSLNISFFVKYSILSAVPAVKTVSLNARAICGPLGDETNTQITTFNNLTRTVQGPGTTTNIIPLPIHIQYSTSQPSSNSVEQPKRSTPTPIPTQTPSRPQGQTFVLPSFRCGVRELGERIFFGIPTTIEQYPWHGTIFHSTEYICGMSLISPYHALTAAHCFYNLFRQPVDITAVNLYFGVSNIRRIRSPNTQSVRVAELFKHPQYEYHFPRYDIAVIKFDRPVRFNERIQPVCLWQEDVDLRSVENKGGVVVGFGLTEVGRRSDQLLWGRIQVVNSDVCREVDPRFYIHLTQYSFCAGNLTRTTVCRGDSGGGMFFQKPNSEIWQIRGITSTSKPNGLACDVDYYAMFTDVAKYKDWVEEQMKK